MSHIKGYQISRTYYVVLCECFIFGPKIAKFGTFHSTALSMAVDLQMSDAVGMCDFNRYITFRLDDENHLSISLFSPSPKQSDHISLGLAIPFPSLSTPRTTTTEDLILRL